ncbi:MAG: phosphotransferase [Ilumatobacteraceae bacterium]
MHATTPIDNELLRVIGAAVGTPVRFNVAPERLTGGFWAAIYGFELQPDDVLDRSWRDPLVLRVMPEAAIAAKEIIVQTVLGDVGYNTPRVVLSGHDDGLGGAFMVMARASGRPSMSGLAVGPSPVKLIRSLRSIPVLLGRAAAGLHAIDPSPIEAALAAAGIHLAPLGDTSYRRDIAAAAETPATGFVELERWLADNTPTVPARVVGHGDLHPLNLLVDDVGNVTVLDWTNANICPPELDIAFTTVLVRCAPIAVPKLARPILHMVTSHLAKRFLSVYRSTPGSQPIDSSRQRWYEALQYGRCLGHVAVGRVDPTAVVGPSHPFETSAPAMIRELAALTDITIALPERQRERNRSS